MYIPTPCLRDMPALQADDDPYVPVPTVTQTVVWRTRPGSLVGGVTAGVVLWFIFTFMIFWNLGRMAWCFARKEDRHPAIVHNIIPPECAFTNATHVRHVYLRDTLSVPHVRNSGLGDFPERTGFTPVSGLSSRRSSTSGSGRQSPRTGGPSPGTSRERMVHFADEVDVMPEAEERRGSQPPEYAPEPSPDCQRCAAGVMPGGYDVSGENGEGVQRSESGARVEVWPGGGEGGGVQLGNGMTKIDNGAGDAGVGQTNGEAGGDVGWVDGASSVAAGSQVAGAVQRVAPSGDERRVDAETVDDSPQGILRST